VEGCTRLIKELLNARHELAVTSDQWHVIHARWSGAPGPARFELSIVSEHDDSASAVQAARELKSSLVPGMTARSKETRDQVIVRRPEAESPKNSGRLERRHK